MTDPFSIAVGVLSTINGAGKLFTTCVDLFNFFADVRSYGKDHAILLTQLDIEKTLLLQWGQRVNLLADVPDPRLSDPATTTAVVKALNCIKILLEDTEKLKSNYGLSQEIVLANEGYVAQSSSMISNSRLQNMLSLFPSFQQLILESQKQTSMARKSMWVVLDKTKFRELLSQLDWFIQKLRDLVPIKSTEQFDMTVEDLSSLSHNPKQLELVEDASRDNHPDWAEIASEMVSVASVLSETVGDAESISNIPGTWSQASAMTYPENRPLRYQGLPTGTARAAELSYDRPAPDDSPDLTVRVPSHVTALKNNAEGSKSEDTNRGGDSSGVDVTWRQIGDRQMTRKDKMQYVQKMEQQSSDRPADVVKSDIKAKRVASQASTQAEGVDPLISPKFPPLPFKVRRKPLESRSTTYSDHVAATRAGLLAYNQPPVTALSPPSGDGNKPLGGQLSSASGAHKRLEIETRVLRTLSGNKKKLRVRAATRSEVEANVAKTQRPTVQSREEQIRGENQHEQTESFRRDSHISELKDREPKNLSFPVFAPHTQTMWSKPETTRSRWNDSGERQERLVQHALDKISKSRRPSSGPIMIPTKPENRAAMREAAKSPPQTSTEAVPERADLITLDPVLNEAHNTKPSHAEQTSLLIEYFDSAGKKSRPSVRVKVRPSSKRRTPTKNDDEMVAELHSKVHKSRLRSAPPPLSSLGVEVGGTDVNDIAALPVMCKFVGKREAPVPATTNELGTVSNPRLQEDFEACLREVVRPELEKKLKRDKRRAKRELQAELSKGRVDALLKAPLEDAPIRTRLNTNSLIIDWGDDPGRRRTAVKLAIRSLRSKNAEELEATELLLTQLLEEVDFFEMQSGSNSEAQRGNEATTSPSVPTATNILSDFATTTLTQPQSAEHETESANEDGANTVLSEDLEDGGIILPMFSNEAAYPSSEIGISEHSVEDFVKGGPTAMSSRGSARQDVRAPLRQAYSRFRLHFEQWIDR